MFDKVINNINEYWTDIVEYSNQCEGKILG